jgi:hypothetical protein
MYNPLFYFSGDGSSFFLPSMVVQLLVRFADGLSWRGTVVILRDSRLRRRSVPVYIVMLLS